MVVRVLAEIAGVTRTLMLCSPAKPDGWWLFPVFVCVKERDRQDVAVADDRRGA